MAEQHSAIGWHGARDFATAHEAMLAAAQIFPLGEEFSKKPAYLDFWAAQHIDPRIGMADCEYALRYDPWAPDLLRGLAVFAARAHQPQIAREAFARFAKTEGCVDCQLRSE